MSEPKSGSPSRWGAIVVILLVVILVVSASVAFARYQPAKPIEITLPSDSKINGTIQIGGAVTSPGIYPFHSGDTVTSLLDATGGLSTTDQASFSLSVYLTAGNDSPQKININTAAAWLLEALPGIGATKAQAIVVYRETNGPYNHTSELMRVAGIGQLLYDEIKDLITVTE